MMSPLCMLFELIMVMILVLLPTSLSAELDQASELKSLQIKIKDVESRIKSAQSETDKLRKELRDNEINSADTLTHLHEIEQQIANKNTELKELQFEQSEYERSLNKEKQKLTGQIRAAYQIGRNDYLKLLLNQEDPARVGRALAYYDYHNRVRTERIENVEQSLAKLNQVKNTIESETTELEILRQDHESKLGVFHKYRASRHDIITRLQTYIDEKGDELETLQENERELSELLQSLKQDKAVTIGMFEDMPPFTAMKGKLEWPIKGRFLKRFGNSKKGGNLKWQGVLIDAETGTNVKAISTGKVVFADWFRNLGLLMIIDHSGGYMSLYGHNQNLLKNTDDWVLAGEQIATVGDSGGQTNTALYFEIRKGAEPLNPAQWCKK